MAVPMSASVASAVPRGRNSSLTAPRTSSPSVRVSSRASIPLLQSAVRLSAWRPRAPQFSRNPPRLLEYQFKRYTVEFDGVNIKLSLKRAANLESICIASDWKTGLAKCSRKEDFSSTGFIGRGSSKNVVYVRLTHFPSSPYSKSCSRPESTISNTPWLSRTMRHSLKLRIGIC